MGMSSSATATRNPETLVRSWLGDAEIDGETDAYTGKRQWPRFKWHAPVTIEVPATGTRRESLYASARDISEGGIGVWCSHAMEANTAVRLYVDDASEYVQGRVRQCTTTVGGFIIGVQFTLPES